MTPTPHGTSRITGLALANWRNFSSIDVKFQRRAFLVGPNASGKSNLLDALRFLRDIVSVGGGFQEATRRRDGLPAIRCLAARQNSNVRIRVEIGSDERPDQWAYELEFNQSGNGHSRPVVKAERVWNEGVCLLNRPDAEDAEDAERLTQTHLEQVGNNQKFRAVAEFLSSIRYLHLVPQLIREPDRSLGVKNDPFGGDFLDQVASTKERSRTSKLNAIARALQAAVPQLNELVSDRDDSGRPHLKAKYEHWRPNGSWQTEKHLSDGTIRLIGILWAALEDGGPMLLEEPELSLHPGVVRHLPRMLARAQKKRGRQLLVSTHSADLLEDEGIGLDEVLLLQPSEKGTNVTMAREIQHVSDLLEGGLTLPEIVLPRTEPDAARQLGLFDLES